MQLGMVGLGRMGANMVRRLLRGGHQCVVFNRSPAVVDELVKEKAGCRIQAKAVGLSNAAIDESVPVPVLSAALYQRFSSRGEADYQNKLLSAMRYGFGGHVEQAAAK